MFINANYSDSEMHVAVNRRDPFFDHIFYQGVITTGIYCRTACPAKLPLPKNARFFPSRTEAEQAGFRPCKRCRPNLASSFNSLTIPLKKTYNYEATLSFLAMRTVSRIEDVSEKYYARSLRFGDTAVALSVHLATAGNALVVRYWGDVNASDVRRAVLKIFDLDAPIAKIRHDLGRDPLLAPLVAEYSPLSLPVYVDSFEGVLRAIVGQLISIKAARTVISRLIEAFGEQLPQQIGGISHVFPSAQTLAGCNGSELRELGLTSSKVIAIQNIARAICSGDLDLTALATSDFEAADRRLQQFSGVGPWTAAIIRMEALGDRNAFPAKDLGVQKAVASLTGKRHLNDRQLAKLLHMWRPWGAYATLYLWKHLDSIEKQ